MRKLTVKRKWSFVECASKIFLYVQCEKGEGNYKINEKYFKEYRLKNGKTVTADIADGQVTVFVTSSTMQVAYDIPAGEKDVALITAPSYNPMQGNPFTIQKA